MPQEYSATDADSGLEVRVTGEFPADPEDRVRIARTTNLFTKRMSTILTTDHDYERRERFKAVETQLEVAEALIRGTLKQMGISEEQMREVERQLREQLASLGRDDLGVFFSGEDAEHGSDAIEGDTAVDNASDEDETPLDDRGIDSEPNDD